MYEEFRKPYEYDEEKHGFILLFIIMLITFDTLETISMTSRLYGIFPDIPVLRIGFVVLGAIFILFILFTAFICFKLNRNMVKISKTYLVVRAVFTTCLVMIAFIKTISSENLIGTGPEQYSNITELLLWEIALPLGYTLIFSGVWYLYFMKSKRCREISAKAV